MDIHQIRTQHPWLYTPVEHTLLIGDQKENDYEGTATKIALTPCKALTAKIFNDRVPCLPLKY